MEKSICSIMQIRFHYGSMRLKIGTGQQILVEVFNVYSTIAVQRVMGCMNMSTYGIVNQNGCKSELANNVQWNLPISNFNNIDKTDYETMGDTR
jgi:hypothetical protein